MAITVSGTSITLNDSSTFATAASTFAAVGSLAAAWVGGTSVGAGQTIAGTSLYYAPAYSDTTVGNWTIYRAGSPQFFNPNQYSTGQVPTQLGGYSTLSGSWRAMENSITVYTQGFVDTHPSEGSQQYNGHEFLFCRVS